MTFAGLSLIDLSTIGVVSSAIILGLYRLRDHRPRRTIASLELYRNLARRSSSSKFLRYFFSIFTQFLLLSSLLIALSDPRIESTSQNNRHVLVLFDTSASMLAMEGTMTRVELGRRQLLRYIESVPPNTEVSLSTFDVALTPKTSWTNDRKALRSIAEGLKARPLPSRPTECLEQAANILKGTHFPELLLITDGARSLDETMHVPPSLRDVKLSSLTVGEAQENVAILGFAPRRRKASPSDVEIWLTIGNFSQRSRHLVVEISVDGHLVRTNPLTLSGFETKRQVEILTLGTARQLHAKLRFDSDQRDALAIDNDADAWLGSIRSGNLLLRTNGNLYLEAAVLSDPWVVPQILPLEGPPPSTPPDVLILDGGTLPRPIPCPTLWLNPPRNSDIVAAEPALVQVGFDTWERQYPALNQLELYDVQITRANRLATKKGDRILAQSGNAPILIERIIDGYPVLILGFDPRQSDFVLRPAWPLFIGQITEQLLDVKTPEISSSLVGFPVAVSGRTSADSQSKPRRIRSPNGTLFSVMTSQGKGVFFPEELGVYEALPDNENVKSEFYSVNLFSPDESRIEPLRPFTLGTNKTDIPDLTPVRERPSIVQSVLVMALVLLGLEWVLFHRRVLV
jgi:hypothetical protein